MTYREPIETPGSHIEPPDEPYCDACEEWADECECDEYYVEEKPDD
jgi:hypothetical protein